MKKFFAPLVFLAVIFAPVSGLCAHKHLEKWYQNQWCEEKGGQAEVVLDDGARIDCLTAKNAVEFDFGPKWAESLGQALFYGAKTGKRAGIVLILEEEGDRRYLRRLKEAIEHYRLPVDLWTISSESKI